jgi:hypothetical protein
MEKVGMGGPLLAGVGRLTCEGAKIQLVSPGATASILQDGRAVFNVGGNEYRIVGDITIRGVTQELVLEAEFAGVHKDPWGGTRTGVTAHGTLSRKNFGMAFNPALETGGVLVGDKVKIDLEVEAVLAQAPAAVV